MDIYRKQLADAGINNTRALEIALAVDKIHAALSRSDNTTRRVICETLPAAVALAVGFGEAEEMATDFTGGQ